MDERRKSPPARERGLPGPSTETKGVRTRRRGPEYSQLWISEEVRERVTGLVICESERCREVFDDRTAKMLSYEGGDHPPVL